VIKSAIFALYNLWMTFMACMSLYQYNCYNVRGIILTEFSELQFWQTW